MASQSPPKRAAAYTYSVSLPSQADGNLFQTSVTIATGDVTWSKDGGAFANVGTLPTEIGTSGVLVGTLTTTETDCDRGVLRFRDAAGSEWADTLLVLDFVAANFDDLSGRIPTALVSGRIDASVGAMAANAITAAAIATDAIDADALAADAIAEINATVDTALADVGLTTTITGRIDATVSSRSSHSAADVWAAVTRTLTANTNLNDPTAAAIRAEIDANSTQLAAIVADTNELQTDNVPGLIAALNNISAADILTSALNESYAAQGAAPTLTQAVMEILQWLTEKSVAGTTATVKRRNGVTTATTYTLDDATTPTAITRA